MRATETTAKTSTWTTMSPPSPAAIAAAIAPAASMPNSGIAVTTSGIPSAAAPTSHHTHASMSFTWVMVGAGDRRGQGAMEREGASYPCFCGDFT